MRPRSLRAARQSLWADLAPLQLPPELPSAAGPVPTATMPMDIDDAAYERQAADLPITYPSNLTLNPAALDRPSEREHEFTTAGFGGALGGGSVREGLLEVADKVGSSR